MENKKKADILLVLLLVLFTLVVLLRMNCSNNYYMKMLSFVFEAALVGGIADWFAITALFKKPLGFPWHTAIIPRNRDKVIDAVAGMVESELLSPKTLKNKISEIDIIDNLIKYIENSEKLKDLIFESIEKYGTRFLDSINTSEISELIENGLKDKLRQADLSAYLSRMLKFAVKSDECEKIFLVILDELISKVKQETAKDEINKIINEVIDENLNRAGGFKRVLLELALGIAKDTNSINTMEVSESIQEQAVLLFAGLKDKNAPEHIEMIHKMEEMTEKLESDEKVIENVEKWKIDTIGKITFACEINQIINNIVNALKFSIKKDNLQKNEVFIEAQDGQSIEHMYKDNARLTAEWLRSQISLYWEEFKTNDDVKKSIDAYIKECIYKIIKDQHSFIGIMVKRVLNNMTDETLNQFIQAKAGNDLHWIRINGCIIGAIFGFIVYVLINNLYLPIVTKLLNL